MEHGFDEHVDLEAEVVIATCLIPKTLNTHGDNCATILVPNSQHGRSCQPNGSSATLEDVHVDDCTPATPIEAQPVHMQTNRWDHMSLQRQASPFGDECKEHYRVLLQKEYLEACLVGDLSHVAVGRTGNMMTKSKINK